MIGYHLLGPKNYLQHYPPDSGDEDCHREGRLHGHDVAPEAS